VYCALVRQTLTAVVVRAADFGYEVGVCKHYAFNAEGRVWPSAYDSDMPVADHNVKGPACQKKTNSPRYHHPSSLAARVGHHPNFTNIALYFLYQLRCHSRHLHVALTHCGSHYSVRSPINCGCQQSIQLCSQPNRFVHLVKSSRKSLKSAEVMSESTHGGRSRCKPPGKSFCRWLEHRCSQSSWQSDCKYL
jgi:hypothetical protein